MKRAYSAELRWSAARRASIAIVGGRPFRRSKSIGRGLLGDRSARSVKDVDECLSSAVSRPPRTPASERAADGSFEEGLLRAFGEFIGAWLGEYLVAKRVHQVLPRSSGRAPKTIPADVGSLSESLGGHRGGVLRSQ